MQPVSPKLEQAHLCFAGLPYVKAGSLSEGSAAGCFATPSTPVRSVMGRTALCRQQDSSRITVMNQADAS